MSDVAITYPRTDWPESNENEAQCIYLIRRHGSVADTRDVLRFCFARYTSPRSPGLSHYDSFQVNDKLITFAVVPSPDYGSRAPKGAHYHQVDVNARLLCEASKRCSHILQQACFFDPLFAEKHTFAIQMKYSSWSAYALAIFIRWMYHDRIPCVTTAREAEYLFNILLTAWELGGTIEAPRFQNEVMRSLAELLDIYALSPIIGEDVIRSDAFYEEGPVTETFAYNVWFAMVGGLTLNQGGLKEYVNQNSVFKGVDWRLKALYGWDGKTLWQGYRRCFRQHFERFTVSETDSPSIVAKFPPPMMRFPNQWAVAQAPPGKILLPQTTIIRSCR